MKHKFTSEERKAGGQKSQELSAKRKNRTAAANRARWGKDETDNSSVPEPNTPKKIGQTKAQLLIQNAQLRVLF